MKLFSQLRKALFEKVASDGSGVEGQFLYNTTEKKPKWHDGTNWQEFGGSSSGGVAFNLWSDYAESGSTTGYTTYNDSTTTTPSDGTGGSPSGLSVSTLSDSNVLRGNRSLLLSKDAANRQGMGWSSDRAVPKADRGLLAKYYMKYKTPVNNSYVDSAVNFSIYDVTNGAFLISAVNLTAMSGNFAVLEGVFVIPSNCVTIRIIFHVASTSASAMDIALEDYAISTGSSSSSIVGWKVYSGSQVTYSSTPAGWSLTAHEYIPYKDPTSGKWRLRFNITATMTATTGVAVGVNGITFEGVNSGVRQSVTCTVAGSTYGSAQVQGNTGNIQVNFNAADTNFVISGDVALASKPTWADFEGTVSLLDNSILYSNARAKAISTSSASIPNETYTVMPLTSYPIGANFFSGNTWVCPASGDYRIVAICSMSSGAGAFTDSNNEACIFKNGTRIFSSGFPLSVNPKAIINTIESLVAGDVIDIRVFHSESPAAVTFVGSSLAQQFIVERCADISANAALGFGIADSNNAGLAQAGNLPAALTDVSALTGKVGEYKSSSGNGTSNSTSSADTYVDVGNMSISLGVGTWIIGYDVGVYCDNVATGSNPAGSVVISDSSNNPLSETHSFMQFIVQSGGGVTNESTLNLSKRQKIYVSTPTTYKLRLRASGASSSYVLNVMGTDQTGLLSGNDNSSNIWAHRIV